MSGKGKRKLDAVEAEGTAAKKAKAVPKAIPSEEEVRDARAKAAAAANIPLANQGWKGGYHLSTNFNSTCLWLRPDANGTIAERVIVKHCNFKGSSFWMDKRLWYGDVKDVMNRVPIELKCLQQLYDCGSDRKWTTELRQFSQMDMAKRQYILYMAYYPHQDLQNATEHYARLTNPMRRGLDRSDYAAVKDWLPEPFLWSIFEGLAKGCLLMEQGTLDRNDIKRTWWEPIVHNDLKSNNVFFGPPDNALWKSYPRPVIADFDRAFIMPRWLPDNPECYRGHVGTPGWIPPESYYIRVPSYLDPKKEEGEKLMPITPQANIWAIGTIMARLVRLGFHQAELIDYDYEVPANRNVVVDRMHDNYSKELLGIIRGCAQYRPDKRPTALQLVNAIAIITDEKGKNLGRGMKTGDAVVFDPTESPDTRLGVPYKQWESAMFALGARVPPKP